MPSGQPPKERAELLEGLIERIENNGPGKETNISFRAEVNVNRSGSKLRAIQLPGLDRRGTTGRPRIAGVWNWDPYLLGLRKRRDERPVPLRRNPIERARTYEAALNAGGGVRIGGSEIRRHADRGLPVRLPLAPPSGRDRRSRCWRADA